MGPGGAKESSSSAGPLRVWVKVLKALPTGGCPGLAEPRGPWPEEEGGASTGGAVAQAEPRHLPSNQ